MEQEKKETIFGQGFYFDKPREGAPEFVKGRVSIKVEEATTFLTTYRNSKGYVNLDLLKKKDGTGYYFTLNQWEPKTEKPESIDAASLVNKPSEPGETTSDGREMPPF
jgi:hypothetical protein